MAKARPPLLSLVGHAAAGRVGDETGVLGQGAAGVARGRRLPGLPARGHLVLGDLKVDDALLGVDDDVVAVMDERDRPAVEGLRHDVADNKAVGAARVAAVGKEGDVLAEAGAYNGRQGLKYLRHARPALRAVIADDNNRYLAFLNLVTLKRGNYVRLAVKDMPLTLKAEALLTSNLAGGAARGERAT